MDQAKLLRATVRIHAYGRPVDISKPFLVSDRTKSVGTGAFVLPPPDRQSPHLFILTCSHCVEMADTVTIMLPFQGMTEHIATVVSIMPRLDLALVALPDPNHVLRDQVEVLPLGLSASLKLGQKLTAVGYPLGGSALKASDGVYAGFQERLQHTVSISPGNSGGPLMNEHGEIVGINNSGIVSPEASNVGFAVPIESYLAVKVDLFRPPPSGSPSPDRVVLMPVYGFHYAPITRAHAQAVGATQCLNGTEGGVQVLTVIPNSPMFNAGVRPDDILVEFDGHAIDTVGELAVEWNYQKVHLSDVLERSIEDRDYSVRVWQASTQECVIFQVRPRVFAPGAFRPIFPPYDTVPYINVVGLVITPLFANHASHPVTIRTYIRKEPHELANPCVIISHIFNGTIAQIEGPLKAGNEVSHVNGIPVQTIDDVRAALLRIVTTPNGHTVLMFRTPTGKTFMVNTRDALATEKRARAEKLYTPYPALLRALRFLEEAESSEDESLKMP